MTICENNYRNGMLREADFKTQYIATFLASYSAWRYERDCQEGHPGQHYANQPVEDANHLANKAWDSIKEELGNG
jgi:hypothetical protein